MKQKIINFLRNIYGLDELNIAIMVCTFIIMIIDLILAYGFKIYFLSSIFSIFNWILLIIFTFRFFSKEHFKRSRANQVYLDKSLPIRSHLKNIKLNLKDRQNKYFVCKECHKNVRVPRHKGNIIITCPNCRNKFEKRT